MRLAPHYLFVIAGLVPAIPLRRARCPPYRDHRDSTLRVGPVMTKDGGEG
jgi:hypothetical protein